MPFLIEPDGIAGERDRAPTRTTTSRDLRAFLGRRGGDAILLGEVNLPHETSGRSSAATTATSWTMLFDFIGMQNMYLALARERRPAARRGADGSRPESPTRLASGRPSCATTTSSPSTS